ncbi:MAG: L-lactate dehydrogenase [Desulfobacterales bacterium]
MAKDPVCGMEVDERRSHSHKAVYMGKTYYFCSNDCKATFQRNPEKHIKASRSPVTAKRKVVVVGTGEVGATLCFALLISGLASDIVLIDKDFERAEGHAMDLNHGLSFVQPTRIFAGNYPDCRDADVVIVTAGAAQKKGETRLDLVRKNTEIFRDIIPKTTEYDPGIILIVSNPVDILTYAAYKFSGYPMNRVIGSGTTLDTARFRFLLSRHCRVDPRNVHAYIIGEHGDSEVPVWSQVNIAGVPLRDYCPVCSRNCGPEEQNEIFQQVKHSAYEIINRKGYTNFAIALALVRILNSILRDENSVLTVSSLIDNYYGVKDVCLSIPCILNVNGVFQHIYINLNEAERSLFRDSADTLKSIIKELRL